jgi:hypothetical protein
MFLLGKNIEGLQKKRRLGYLIFFSGFNNIVVVDFLSFGLSFAVNFTGTKFTH